MMNPKRRADLEQPDRLATYFRLEWWPLLLTAVSGVLYNVGMAAGPWFEGQLAQRLCDVLAGSKTFRDMLTLAGAYVGVTLFVQAMRYVKRFYVRRFANDTARTMKRVLYNTLVHTAAPDLEGQSAGSLMTKAVADVDACAEGMRKFTTELFDTGVVMAAYLALLLHYDWRLTLLCCAFPPFAYIIARRLKAVVFRSTAAFRESAGRLNEATMDRVAGAVTYRVAGREQNRDAAYEGCLADYEGKAVRASVWENAMQPLYQAISMASVVFILWFGSRNVAGTGWSGWNIAAFTAFLACYTRLAVKSSKAAKLFNAVQKAQVSWGRIKPLLRPMQQAPEVVPAAPAALEVSGLSFAWPGGEEVFHGVSFAAQPGQIIGITGPVACGKSTLGRAFLCEHPYGGSIRLGGAELRDMTPRQRAGAVAWLGHNPELLSDTVAENIRLGDAGVDVEHWLRLVCMDAEVAAMPQGAETPVGTGGVCLSGGQRARLALARTLCRRRPLLVLDDPFAALDRPTEQALFEHLRAGAGEGVILLISHRLYLFPQLDRVVWLDRGTAQTGSHGDIMAAVPDYAALYNAQTEENSHEA